MRNPCVVVGLGLLAFAVAIGTGVGQDKKEDPKKGDPQPGVKGTLPANWGKLGLTPDQKGKIYGVQQVYKPKIDNLKKQVKILQDEEYAEMYKILNEDQKASLKKILDKGGDTGKDTKKDDKKEEKKDSGK